jgi:hypothetical protein
VWQGWDESAGKPLLKSPKKRQVAVQSSYSESYVLKTVDNADYVSMHVETNSFEEITAV